MQTSSKRIIFDVALLCSLLLLPWWATCTLVLVGIFIFMPFFEGIFAGLLLDVLFGGPLGNVWQSYPYTISIGVVFLLSFWITEHLTLSNRME